MTSLYFEGTDVGNRRTAGPHLVSKNQIIELAARHDPQPSHIDEEAAARSVFAGLTASRAHAF
jgi:acyl dehydratase